MNNFSTSLLSVILSVQLAFGANKGNDSLYLSDKPIPYLFPNPEDKAPKIKPLLEIGDPFLNNGNLKPGHQIFTGAVWQPRFWLYGNYRTAIQNYEVNNGSNITEWANRLDLFGNLQLTGTERIVIGVQPLHDKDGFSGTRWTDGSQDGIDKSNLKITTLFFEGDLAEVFPNFDPLDEKGLDIGFSVGRQTLNFQDGLLINDNMDAIGFTKNSLRPKFAPWINNWRITTLYAWNEISRDDNKEQDEAQLFGLFQALDTRLGTHELDLVYVKGDPTSSDLLAWGVGDIFRIHGSYNMTLRYNGSKALNQVTAQSEDGQLFFGELSWTPHNYEDVIYINTFLGIDNFTSAARDESAGGPLGRTGLLFAARGLGRYPSPLSNRSDHAHGIAIGRQFIFEEKTQHIILEAGYRGEREPNSLAGAGLAFQWQKSFALRHILQFDTFASRLEGQHTSRGVRGEWQIKF